MAEYKWLIADPITGDILLSGTSDTPEMAALQALDTDNVCYTHTMPLAVLDDTRLWVDAGEVALKPGVTDYDLPDNYDTLEEVEP